MAAFDQTGDEGTVAEHALHQVALAEPGLQIVAEGVETTAAATTLLRLGCHRAQGFLLSRPLPSDQMATLYRKGRVPVRFTSEM